MLFNVGDLVIVKEWNDMLTDGGSENRYGHIKFANSSITFTQNMSVYCGRIYRVGGVYDDYYILKPDKSYEIFPDPLSWWFTDNMLKPYIKNYNDEFDTSLLDEMLDGYSLLGV